MSEECGSELNSAGYYSFSGFDTKTPFLIGVAGGTASGKTSVCRKIMSRVGQEGQVVCIHQDNFYKGLSPLERDRANRGLFNYDHPDVFDDELMAATLSDILQEKVVQLPVYDFITSTRLRDQWISIAPADVVLVEGVLLFYFPRLRDMFHMKLFVDTDPDTRLARRGQTRCSPGNSGGNRCFPARSCEWYGQGYVRKRASTILQVAYHFRCCGLAILFLI
ncbi:uridine-cytidine kinase isoform X3 [Dermacentor variabilis]|uniref:uridine-cytidine kinase isoform X3 n=1 Tax=Dermacentor variabilis TaxID=34621 RepID=UPI003F5B225A